MGSRYYYYLYSALAVAYSALILYCMGYQVKASSVTSTIYAKLKLNRLSQLQEQERDKEREVDYFSDL